MKRTACFALSLLIAAGSLASCASTEPKYSSKISVSSSEALPDAQWLTERLGTLKDSVHLSIGDGDFDMSDFEDDGYIIRASDGDAVIVGKTADGLTSGVRKYAGYAEKNQADSLDISYHEGVRVEKLILGNADISEYVIEYPESGNDNMKFAIEEFIQLTEKACGVKLTSSQGITDRKYAIEFRQSDDPSLKSDGYRYFFEGDRFVIEGAIERGCMFGVYRFFKNELDWMGLTRWDTLRELYTPADSVLPESELIEIPSDTKRAETPSFGYFNPYLRGSAGRKSDIPEIADAKDISYQPDPLAMHGMTKNDWGGYHPEFFQICYSDEDVLENVFTSVYDYVWDQVNSGKEIGKDLTSIDIGQGDNGIYCTCNECLSMVKEEGGAISGTVVRFANRLAEDMSVDFDGLIYKIYAYHGSQKPPKTAPHKDVYVTLCYDGSCAAHPLDTDECTNEFSIYAVGDHFTNKTSFAQWTKDWCALSENIIIWYYILDYNVDQYTVLDVMYDDMKFMAGCGAKGLFLECETVGLGETYIIAELCDEMNWRCDMTRGEYNDYLCKILEKEFGDGWAYILEYIDMWQESQTRTNNCWTCWDYVNTHHIGQYDTEYVFENFDLCTELVERALELAENKRQIRNCELFSVHVLYQGCFSSYFREYDEGDTARIEELNERYTRMIDRMNNNGIGIKKFGVFKVTINATLEDQAWKKWKKVRSNLPSGETVRPAP